MGAVALKGRKTIRLLNSITDMIIIVITLLMLGYGGYALWDSHDIEQKAEASSYAIYKPGAAAGPGFAELAAMNPDVFGWISIYGTPIDYPLVQTDNNWKYINTSAEGTYSLTGAIFLDCESAKDFSDFNTIIYGHNMTPKVMFGSIKDFKTKDFFDTHRYGDLFYGDVHHGLEIIALLDVNAYDGRVYRTNVTGSEAQKEFISYALSQAVFSRETNPADGDHFVLLSTCSNMATNARDVLLTKITDQTYENEFITAEQEKTIESVDRQQGGFWKHLSVMKRLLMIAFAVMILSAVLYKAVKHHRIRKGDPCHNQK